MLRLRREFDDVTNGALSRSVELVKTALHYGKRTLIVGHEGLLSTIALCGGNGVWR